MPYGAFINTLPPALFMAVRSIGFLRGAFWPIARLRGRQA
jgi:hypothetical protein